MEFKKRFKKLGLGFIGENQNGLGVTQRQCNTEDTGARDQCKHIINKQFTKISLTTFPAMPENSVVTLNRTDTTLDLSQQAREDKISTEIALYLYSAPAIFLKKNIVGGSWSGRVG